MDARDTAWRLAKAAGHSAARAIEPLWATYKAERAAQAALLRDLFGNPFRTIRRDRVSSSLLTWHEATIPMLAQAIYKERTFDLMGILADALEDAGCTTTDILNHSRCQRDHARGCFVLDLLLVRQ
jgi:hypothetical protein